METVEGIILILSCQKHLNTRIPKFGLKNKQYNNWKVIYVIGDIFLNKNYELQNNFLYVKCEDSYIHLLKKLVLSIKYVNEIYNIKQGILRCGDDLIFNEQYLLKFLKTDNKPNFYGKAWNGQSYQCENVNILKKTKQDLFMYHYYLQHPEDFDNPNYNLHNLSSNKLLKYSIRPDIWGPVGIIYYVSNKSCDILVKHMENIHYDIFHYDNFTNSYPYTIEDVAFTYILYYNNIKFVNNNDFFDTKHSIVTHTNMYK